MPTTAEGRLARPQALPLFTRQRRFCAVQALGCHRRFYYSTLSTNRSSRFAWPRQLRNLALPWTTGNSLWRSRPAYFAEIGRFARFEVVQLRGFSEEDAATLLREYEPGLPEAIVSHIVGLSYEIRFYSGS